LPSRPRADLKRSGGRHRRRSKPPPARYDRYHTGNRPIPLQKAPGNLPDKESGRPDEGRNWRSLASSGNSRLIEGRMPDGTMTNGQEEWGLCWSSAIVPLAMLDSVETWRFGSRGYERALGVCTGLPGVVEHLEPLTSGTVRCRLKTAPRPSGFRTSGPPTGQHLEAPGERLNSTA
jgi:hypothetical protein